MTLSLFDNYFWQQFQYVLFAFMMNNDSKRTRGHGYNTESTRSSGTK